MAQPRDMRSLTAEYSGPGGPFRLGRILFGYQVHGDVRRPGLEHAAQFKARKTGQFGVHHPQVDGLRTGKPQSFVGRGEERQLQVVRFCRSLPGPVVLWPRIDNADGLLLLTAERARRSTVGAA